MRRASETSELPEKVAKAIPSTNDDPSPPIYDERAVRHSFIFLGATIFNSITGLVHYSKFKSWESTNWGERVILIGGIVSAVGIPFQFNKTMHVLRHYDREPYRWTEFWVTVSILIVGTGVIFAGLITYYWIEEGKKVSLLNALLFGLGTFFSIILLLGIPYAYFQFSRLGSGRLDSDKFGTNSRLLPSP